MKAFVLSDIHTDMWFCYACKPSRLKGDDPKEDVTVDTLEYLWKMREYPLTDAIIVPGDIANDYLTYTRTVKWLAGKYKQVYICFGNHDILVRGATPSQSNLQFDTSDHKIAAIKEFAKAYPNVHIMDGDVIDGIAGTMGMCDLKCEAPAWANNRLDWEKWFDGKHWKHHISKDPEVIWNHYDEQMTNMLKQKPKIIFTHFVPYQAGVSFEYRNDPCNKFFYFDAEKYLDMMEDRTKWFCGHVHDKKICHWVNKNGNHIDIICNPSGYPGEGNMCASEITITENNEYKRGSKSTTWDDFIVDLEEYEDVELEVTDEQLAQLQAAADMEGMTLQNYINHILRTALKDGAFEEVVNKIKENQ